MKRATIAAAAAFVAVFLCAESAQAHSWYSKRQDPIYGTSCCGGSDCAPIPSAILAGAISINDAGYVLTLTLEQARMINPNAMHGVNALIPWDRVQQSEDGSYHACLFMDDRKEPRGGVICFFAPPNS